MQTMQISRCAKSFCSPEWHWRNDGSLGPELNVWLVLDGAGHLRTAEEYRELRRGDCFLFRHSRPHLATHDPTRPLVVPWVAFYCLDAHGRRYEPADAELPRFHRRLRDVSFFDGLIERCITASTQEEEEAALHWLEACLLELRHQDALADLPPAQQELIGDIDALCGRIAENVARPPSVQQMAEQFGYSVDHFIRLFRRVRGLTPGEFVIRHRITAAEELLRSTVHSVTQISQMLGYTDVYAFSKQFRQRVGQSPTAYRRGETL
jgi:AraC-like DNA-binding protein